MRANIQEHHFYANETPCGVETEHVPHQLDDHDFCPGKSGENLGILLRRYNWNGKKVEADYRSFEKIS